MRDWKRIGFVLSSQLRFQILVKLYSETRTPTELSNLLHSPISHVSKHLGELVEENYADCLTPDRRKNKKFAASRIGRIVIRDIQELTDVEKITNRRTKKSESYHPMREISSSCYEKFLEKHDEIVIEDRVGNKPVEIQLTGETKVKQFQPEDFELEATNVWSYPRRGDWATHRLPRPPGLPRTGFRAERRRDETPVAVQSDAVLAETVKGIQLPAPQT